MPNNMYKRIVLYDAERNITKGNGYYSKSFNRNKLTEEEIEEQIKKYREDQKKKNFDYTQNRKKDNEEKLKVMTGDKNKFEARINMQNLPTIQTEVEIKFDSNTGNSILILGSSKMGKSTLLMHLYDKYFNNKNIVSVLFTMNQHINIYKDHKNLIVCGAFNRESENLIKEQKYINTKTDNKYSFCNMLDDIIDVRFSKLLNNLILTYRNSNISSIVSLQYPRLLNKSSRANVNNIILFNFNTDETCIDAIKLYLKSYFIKLGYKSENEQLALYKELTKNHGFVYINTVHNIISFHRLNI